MYRSYIKRILDVSVAGAALIVLSPVLLVLAIGVRRSSPGPAIFRQMRVGRNGTLFELLKFRSMPIDTANVASDILGTVDIRPFGLFIRRTSLDELPQLLNILRGDMSIVGPRPPLPTQVELVAERHRNGAIACRPGLTGLAQINGFDGMSVAQKAEYDARYAAQISFAGDFSIFLRTFAYVLRPPPVY